MKFLFLGVLLTTSIFARTQDEIGTQKFCADHSSTAAIAKSLQEFNNLISFSNASGLLGINTGVCWWHSRLQRKMAYLADFRPELQGPTTREEGKALINKIIYGKEVVIVPGFKNLREFSLGYHHELQQALNDWMAKDSFVNQTWIKGLKGNSSQKPEKFQAYLDQMYQDFQASDGIVMQILQFEGITAHAWLLTNMEAKPDGYLLEVIDSNYPLQTLKIFLDRSATSLNASRDSYRQENREVIENVHQYYPDFSARTDFKKELVKLKSAVSEYCVQK
jgi:hypothetical protein